MSEKNKDVVREFMKLFSVGDTKAALGADGEIWVKLAVGVHLASSLSVPKGHAPSGKAIFPVKTGVP